VIDLKDVLPEQLGARTFDGIVKIKLVHAPGCSIFLTDMLFIEQSNEWLWFQPHLFDPPIIGFFNEGSMGRFSFNIESGAFVWVGITDSSYIDSYADHSHLFRCRISGPDNLSEYAAGKARRRTDGGFDLRLFHHTTKIARQLILNSGVLRGSEWNFQGTSKLKNVTYAYLTRLPSITSEADLQLIAMSSEGVIYFLLDDYTPPSGIVPVKVYRESTSNRDATIPFWVRAESIASSHVLMHSPANQPVYYEVSNPAIARIGIEPGHEIPIISDELVVDRAPLKRFNYVVIGDATDPQSIVAPLNEEDTDRVFKIETSPLDPLSFWNQQRNTDQFRNRYIDLQKFWPEQI
jgi:hypothetical protein